MAEVDLDELERLEREATRPPWTVLACGTSSYPEYELSEPFFSCEQGKRDQDFIAALRNAAPALLSAARERDELRREVGELREKMDDARKLLLKGSDTTALAVLTFALRKAQP